ncbi:MAG: dihydroorotase [Flavobacteriales bacterium]|jgi:dihydroorotase|nr:dihydroorotase [Flavobacteriales bacterium]|tara:strand:- start:1914 stop:3248 length:1335 start_codon:yes stop_codon:yes gene_type:complete
MSSTLIRNANLINEGQIIQADLLIKEGVIAKIATSIDEQADHVIDAKGKYLMPGVIDDQVHFREPGLTHKAELYTESKAAVAGGITSFMEMPNTKPQTLTQELLEQKYQRAKEVSLANYSFFMGASNDNLEEVLKTDPKTVGAIKIFMGSSTGNMLVDDKSVLENIFEKSKMLIAVHCEDEATIQKNTAHYKSIYGEDVPIELHPKIRSDEACYKSSSMAIELAKKHNTRLHVFHLSTAKEMELFRNDIPLEEKRITAEVCIHHLWFDDSQYAEKGTHIKWNPAVKSASDRDAVFEALLNDRIDVIATDHAPHTLEEKNNTYFNAPSGGPLVQHALVAMLEFYHQGKISLEKIVEKMCHAPAICFQVQGRGFLREGYAADLVLIDLDSEWQVQKENILYKCAWSPFEGTTFKSRVSHTFVNGHLAYYESQFDESIKGQRLLFDR